jgi:membrane fusion protein (multidrug efflux system)
LTDEPEKPPKAETDPDAAHKRRLFVIIGSVVVLLVAIGALIWWRIARNYESTDDAFIDAHIVHLAPQIAGRVLHVSINDNGRVTEGQALIEIDPRDENARLAQLRAQVAQAEAQLAEAKAQVEVSQAAYQQSLASATGAAAQATNAARDLDRYRGLTEVMPAAVAAQQNDQAQATAVNLSSQHVAAGKQVAMAKAQGDAANAAVLGAEAQLKAVQAQFDQARLNFGYTLITAPVAGTIAHLTVAVGDYVQAGQEILAIVPFDIWITANFKETQLTLMRPGQKVAIRIDAFPDIQYTGHIDSIERGAGEAFSLLPPENATGNYVKVVQRVPVKILIDGPDNDRALLGPGMSADPNVRVRP